MTISIARLFAAALLVSGLLAHPVSSARAESADERVISLVEAYQSGYLQVVSVSCYQIYATTGIIQADFLRGAIDGATAAQAIESNALLLSVCYTTVDDILQHTPNSDKAGKDELVRLKNVLMAEDKLLSALIDMFGQPDDQALNIVEEALAGVEDQLVKLTDSEPISH